MLPHITGLRGDVAGKTFPLGDAPTVFGRSPENTVVLSNARSSRRHAEIRREGADYMLIDLGSSNGTVVNNQRIVAPHRLRPGDIFEIGDDVFRFDAPIVVTDATLIAAPAPTAPPTAPATPQPSYQPPPQPQAYVGALPPTPPAPAAPAKKSGGSRTILMVIGLVSVVLLVACIGGAFMISRSRLFDTGSTATRTPGVARTPGAARTPVPTPEGGSSGNEPAPTREPVANGAEWTVLVYLDGDNNLETDAIKDFNEMELAGSNDKVNIVVQFDRIQLDGPEDDASNGDWTTTKRFLVQKDSNKDEIASEELEDLGELNMGDPQTLTDFVIWGVQQYPAQRYALVLWDHGSAWAGIAFDDTDGERGIRLPELDAALRTAQSQTGIGKLDIIGFDACLMSQVDVLHAVAPHANVIVASAELEPGDGWAWDIWLKKLNEEPTQDAASVATSIVDAYQQFYKNSDDQTITLSAFDLSRFTELRDGLNTFSDAMINDLNGSYTAIAEARSYVDAYSQPKPEEFSAIDLGDFARLVREQGASNSIAEPAAELIKIIEESRIAEWHGEFHANSTGISVFFPQVADLYPPFYEEASPLPRDTSWAQFITAFHTTGGTQVTAPEITNLLVSSTTVGVNNPLTLEGSVSGQDIANIFFFVGIPNDDRSSIQLTDIDYIYPPGSSPNTDIPPWEDGVNDLRVSWGGTSWALSNGADTIPVLLGPAKYGADLYGVEGVYTVQGSGERIGAGLLFQVRQGQATLQRIYGFPKGQKQESQPFEIMPLAGDTFTAFHRIYTITDGKPVPDFVEGDTITIGESSLTAQQIPANSGDYVAGFLVLDISGQFNYQYVDITVDNSGAGPVNPPGQQIPVGPGSQAGTLAFTSSDLGFSLDYPDVWQTLDTGNSQVFFYDPAETSATYVSVDVYSVKQRPEQANRELLAQYLEALGKENDFRSEDVRPFTLAGERGQSAAYSYVDTNGNQMSGMAIVITSPRTNLSYIVTVQALSSDWDGQADAFNAVLDSMKVE